MAGGSIEWIMETPTFGSCFGENLAVIPKFTPLVFTDALGCGPNGAVGNPKDGDTFILLNAGNIAVTSVTLASDQVTVEYVPPAPPTSYPAAFQANTSDLWVVGPQGNVDTGLGMMANTSPSIAALPNGDHVVAFQANTSNLWVVGPQGNVDTGLGMMANTSPSIAALPNGDHVVAFQANTSNLWIVGPQGNVDTGLRGMMANTSPSIAAR